MSKDRNAHGDLRSILIDTIERVRSGTLDPQEGKTIAELSKVVISNDRLELDAMRLLNGDGRKRFAQTVSPNALTVERKPDGTELGPLRDKLFDELTKQQPQKPAVLAATIRHDREMVLSALNHEWFEATPDGYRIAVA